jgi:hypothetical protein
LAYRLPVTLAAALFLGGCYTLLRHPTAEITADAPESYRYSDCGSCHSTGFERPLLPRPYDYVAWPFEGFYDTPWWLPDYGQGLLDYPVGSGTTADEGEETVMEGDAGGRHVGGRGPGLPSLPPNYTPALPDDSAAGPASEPAGDVESDLDSQGQQPGRRMKEDRSRDSSEDEDVPEENEGSDPKTKDKPSDDGTGG